MCSYVVSNKFHPVKKFALGKIQNLTIYFLYACSYYGDCQANKDDAGKNIDNKKRSSYLYGLRRNGISRRWFGDYNFEGSYMKYSEYLVEDNCIAVVLFLKFLDKFC